MSRNRSRKRAAARLQKRSAVAKSRPANPPAAARQTKTPDGARYVVDTDGTYRRLVLRPDGDGRMRWVLRVRDTRSPRQRRRDRQRSR